MTATIKAPASVTASYTLTLPATAGAVDQVLKTDASGNLGWVNQTAAATDATTTAKGIVQLAGDLSGTAAAPTVKGINGTALSGLSTGILKNTTTTGVPSIAVAADFPVLNQNTTGSAASFTGSLAGEVTGTQGATTVSNSAVINKVLTGYTSTVGTVAATDNIVTAIGKLNANSSANANATHTGDATGATALTVKGINGTLLSGLSTGILKNTTTTGVPSIAVAADFPVLNQNTTGTAASFTGSLAGDVTGTQGATVVTKLQGKSVSTTAPTNGQVLKYNTTTSVWEPATDAGISTTLNSANLLVGNASNVATAVAMSGDATMDNTGVLAIGASKITSAKIADGTIATADVANSAVSYAKIQNVSATDKVLGRTTAGAGVVEEISTTGSGNVVRATSPTLVTPNLGTPSTLVGTNITGTAAGLTAGTVTTNANLTGEVTSVGNAATVSNSGSNRQGFDRVYQWRRNSCRRG